MENIRNFDLDQFLEEENCILSEIKELINASKLNIPIIETNSGEIIEDCFDFKVLIQLSQSSKKKPKSYQYKICK